MGHGLFILNDNLLSTSNEYGKLTEVPITMFLDAIKVLTSAFEVVGLYNIFYTLHFVYLGT